MEQTIIDIPEAAWRPIGETDPHTRLLTTVIVAGQCSLHLEARQITVDDSGMQEMIEYPADMEALCELYLPDSGYETYEAFGRTYVLFATPYSN